MELIFLGTCGGRYATGQQMRKTGGIVVKSDESQIHIDPGPGALVESHQNIKPEKSEGLIISHAHLDHSSDAEPIIEMITEAYGNECYLFGNKSSLEGFSDLEKTVSKYHQDFCNNVTVLEESSETDFKDLKLESQEMFHSDPKTIGFTIEDEKKKIGFWTDTEYSEELLPFYEDTDVMVIYCTRPRKEPVKAHTSVNDIPKIMDNVEAETCIVTHFGMKFLHKDLEEERDWLQNQIEGKVIFAEDGMKFPGNRTLNNF